MASYYSQGAQDVNLDIPSLSKFAERLYRGKTYDTLHKGLDVFAKSLNSIDDIDISPKLRELLKHGTIIYKNVGNSRIAFYKDEDGDLWEIPKSELKSTLKQFGEVLKNVSGLVLIGLPLYELFTHKADKKRPTGNGLIRNSAIKQPHELTEADRKAALYAQRLNIAISFLKNAKFIYDLVNRK